ncbi:Gfo/Idh/MocA family protein [Compostimonas suwonensis]|uniref:Putative dehydrogenase n=1 Tax=Compostimonas suwonensis TaxID=1048394 RepID=A0A2M9C0D1_9MICO|nr:Gfo/Idh/MocA family oxidoreductase [Compostimonas suwonensis]PJJ63760.1 putative dehydrogenase [Compostimonas suwonensis]
MRVAFIGVSHWHTPYYLPGVIGEPDVRLVGVADPRPGWADDLAAKTGATAYLDYRRMIEVERPELVFAFGRHREMAEQAEFLIRSGIPFAMEKPTGISVSQIEVNERLAREAGAFVAVPFTMRMTPFRRLIAELSPGVEMSYGIFRQIPGSAQRYRDWGAEWHLQRAESGGGTTLNLSIHYFDLVRALAPSADWRVAGAAISGSFSGEEVDDLSLVVLSAGDSIASIETGYLPNPVPEVVLEVCAGDTYYRWLGETRTVVATPADGPRVVIDGGTDQAELYPAFVRDVIRRVREGEGPQTDLGDMLGAARLAEAAYRRAGDTASMS